MAAYLGIPEEIQSRPSTTDTYSLEQSQEEFYFAIPLAKMEDRSGRPGAPGRADGRTGNEGARHDLSPLNTYAAGSSVSAGVNISTEWSIAVTVSEVVLRLRVSSTLMFFTNPARQ